MAQDPKGGNLTDRLKPQNAVNDNKPMNDDERKKVAEDQARKDAEASAEKARLNAEAQRKITAGEKQEGETETVVNANTDVPDSEKTGAIMPSSTTVGADDANPNLVSDTAAESSTLSRNAMDTPFGRGSSVQDHVPSADRASDREISKARGSTGEDKDVKYYRTGFSGMGFGVGPKGDKRVRFNGRVLVTSDPEVIEYIEQNFLNKGINYRVEEISEDDYREHRSHGDVVATDIRMEDVDSDKIRIRQNSRALTARMPRTDKHPDVMGAPEIGNAQQDHFTQADRIIEQERPGTSTGNIQLQRNKAELAAAAGASPAVDARANQPAPESTGPTNSVNMAPRGAPRKP